MKPSKNALLVAAALLALLPAPPARAGEASVPLVSGHAEALPPGLAGAAPPGLADVLPPERPALDAILAHPLVSGADSGLARERAASERLRLGSYETQLELGAQRLSPGETGGGPEVDWSVALSRPLRLPAKRDADLEIGRSSVERGAMAALDARHETARMLLSRWFGLLRGEAAAAQAAGQVGVLGELADVVRRRMRAGDAARLEQLQAQAAQAYALGELEVARQRVQVARIALEREFPALAGMQLPRLDAAAGAPVEPAGSREDWVQRIMSIDHELGMQRAESAVLRARALRIGAERTPDPSIGVRAATDRARQDRVLGLFVSIPLAGGARVAAQREALALADEGEARVAAVQRRVLGAAQAAYETARAGARAWRALSEALQRAQAAAGLAARAFELGEGTLTEVLVARRAVLDATLAERSARIDALEAHARLRLDAHLLWELDGPDPDPASEPRS